MKFTAIDFETFSHDPASACAVGLVQVARNRIVARHRWPLRPPSLDAEFPFRHCESPTTLRRSPTFGQVAPMLVRILQSGDFVAAHNAAFDLRVLAACCRESSTPMPSLRVVCTMKLAKGALGLSRVRLPDVCRFLQIDLDHHDPLSDAEAAARIVLTAGPDWVERVVVPTKRRSAA